MIGAPTQALETDLGSGIGTFCFPFPNPAHPGIFVVATSLPSLPGQILPGNPTPWSFAIPGLPFAATFTLQAVVQTGPTAVGVSNAIVVAVL